jgi:hypothetical protein
MNYIKETYTGQYGPFDYLIVPKAEYSSELVAKVHGLPFLLSEWSEFHRCRFKMVNGVNWAHEVKGDFIKLPIITEKECWELGL